MSVPERDLFPLRVFMLLHIFVHGFPCCHGLCRLQGGNEAANHSASHKGSFESEDCDPGLRVQGSDLQLGVELLL